MKRAWFGLLLLIPVFPASAQSPNYGSGFTTSGLTLNGGATISGTKLQLTDGGSGEARSAFFNTPVNVQGFTNTFTFQLPNASADGFTFTIQNNSPTALGVGGASLGYGPNTSSSGGIPNSIAVKFDLYSNAGEGSDSTGLYTNGVSPTVPATDMTSSGVNLHSGDTFKVTMSYNGTTLAMQITDTVTNATFSTSFAVNIPGVVGGNTAYVGFTGGTGGLTATQNVLTWTYTPSGPVAPTISTQPANQTVTAGQTATFTVVASGTPTPTYQWLENTGSGFANISGATAASYTTPATTLANSGTTFEVMVSNSQGSVTSNVATLTVNAAGTSPGFGSGFTSAGLTLNGGATISGTRLRVTDGGAGEARSAFFNTPVNVQSFTNNFTFQDSSASADGFCFVIQASGPTALGTGGGSLGYAGATGPLSTQSLCIDFDLYNNATHSEISNTGLFTNGASPAGGAGSAAGSLSFQSGDVMSVEMNYNGTTLAMQITDTVTNATFSTSFAVNIPSLVGGNTAYVGFTGASGGLTAIQDILTWTFAVAGPAAPTITTQPANQTVAVGQTATFSVVASGNPMPTYQWLENTGSGFANISGATAASYTTPATTLANSGTTFEVKVSNSQGSVTSNVATLTVNAAGTSPGFGSGFTSAGLTLNGGATISGTRLRVTDGGAGEARSAFFNTPVNVQSFTNNFTFQDSSASADGFCFVIQASGPTALGSGGGSLGYAGATGPLSTQSLCIDFDLYNNATHSEISNTGLFTNGASPAGGAGSAAGSLSFQSGDVMSVEMNYNGTTLAMQIIDTVTNATFSTSFAVNIPSLVGGNTAYVGFTGASGGLTAIQDILTWTFAVAGPAAPIITTQPANQTVAVGQTATFSVVASGNPMPTYQWLENTGSGFANISGATAASYTTPATTLANSGTTFEVKVSNSQGSVTSNVATLTVNAAGTSPSFGSGFTSAGLTLNGGAAISGTRLRVTDGGAGEARSAFFNTPVNVQSFITDFTFQLSNANADGFTFTIQNNSSSALGVGGGSLGYGPSGSSGGGIPNSIAVKFDLYSNAGEGSDSTGLYTDGASPTVPSVNMSNSGVNLHSGDVMSGHLAYDGSTLTLIITDTNTNASFSTNFALNIPGTVGANTAYVGFTGGTGGLTATQDILTWTYNSVPVTAFTWPVNTPITYAAGSSGGPNDYSTYDGPGPIFGSYHTGIDVCPQSPGCAIGNSVYASSSGIVELALVVSDPNGTLCDGSSTAGYQINPNTSNLGNVVVIAHPNGKFTLYGHMDCIWPGIVPGLKVSAGTRIGNMGHSEFGERDGTFEPHTHFEMKDRAVTGDSTNEGYSGYVPDLPDGYGYHDARIYINTFSTTAITPTAVKVGSSTQNVLTGPAAGFAFLATVSPGQEFVAFASSGSWYQVYLPNDNAPISGWIQATPDSSATQIQVTGAGSSGLLIQAAASSGANLVSWDETFFNCNPAAKIWNGQLYVSPANQNGFYQFYLPSNYYFSSANSCAQPSGTGPSVGWAPGASLTIIP